MPLLLMFLSRKPEKILEVPKVDRLFTCFFEVSSMELSEKKNSLFVSTASLAGILVFFFLVLKLAKLAFLENYK